jgi:hypothetical protein
MYNLFPANTIAGMGPSVPVGARRCWSVLVDLYTNLPLLPTFSVVHSGPDPLKIVEQVFS